MRDRNHFRRYLIGLCLSSKWAAQNTEDDLIFVLFFYVSTLLSSFFPAMTLLFADCVYNVQMNNTIYNAGGSHLIQTWIIPIPG